MAKATVQAALGPVMLKRINSSNTDEERYYAEIIVMVCILSIVVTAPIGAILISLTGPRLLTKTKSLPPTEGNFIKNYFGLLCFLNNIKNVSISKKKGWRRSHRPSLYDISIIDEKEEREDPELQEDIETVGNTNSNANKTVFTITK